MRQKQTLISIALIICALNLYATDVPTLTFADTVWNFGSIKESGGKVSHTFVCRNTSSQPVVIVDVAASCGCTVPDYSRKPIMPGEQSTIKVTYDPTDRPGTFAKSLTVYGAGRRLLAELQIKGNVIERERTVEELYPFDMGGGLRFDANYTAFSYIYLDRISQASIGYANTSDRPINITLTPRRQSGFLLLTAPSTIAAGAKGKIAVSYNIPSSSGRYGTIEDELAVTVDGVKSRYPVATHGTVVDNPDDMSDISAPESFITKNIIKFETLKHSQSKQTRTFILENNGNAPLVVRKVECGGGVECSLRAGQSIAAGAKVQAEVAIFPQRLDYGAFSTYVVVVTNDPVRPMRRVRVTAMVVE